MVRYTVVWQTEVRDALAAIWINAGDRNAVSTAADLIDRELARDPQQQGQPVGDRLRVLREPPLEVLFQISDPDRLVKVVAIRRTDSDD